MNGSDRIMVTFILITGIFLCFMSFVIATKQNLIETKFDHFQEQLQRIEDNQTITDHRIDQFTKDYLNIIYD